MVQDVQADMEPQQLRANQSVTRPAWTAILQQAYFTHDKRTQLQSSSRSLRRLWPCVGTSVTLHHHYDWCLFEHRVHIHIHGTSACRPVFQSVFHEISFVLHGLEKFSQCWAKTMVAMNHCQLGFMVRPGALHVRSVHRLHVLKSIAVA